MASPTDTLYASGLQWHFNLIGDIETIWDEYTGAGVNVGVYDDGVQYTHPDLNDNYDGSLHVVQPGGGPIDPAPNLTNNDSHGTAVAGIIAAEANGEGGVGVAYGATITGVNIFDSATYGFVNGTYSNFAEVVSQATNFDISSNSWGSTPSYSSFQNLNTFSFASELSSEYDLLSANGRGGLGTIITQAAGNDTRDANGSGVNALQETITVAATGTTGFAASYSNFGSNILITAPAASYTTDLLGDNGYNSAGTGDGDSLSDTDYTGVFGGTSAATPVTSGVIALMLEANPNLGWRDVQEILAVSAHHTGSALGAGSTGSEVEAWQINGASNWNGGGMTFNASYGYGMIDVYQAVRMAEAWEILFDTPQTSANQQTAEFTATIAAPLAIPDGAVGVSFTINSTTDLDIEHIQLSLGIDHDFIGDLEIFLTSPDNVTMQVSWSSLTVGTNFDGVWTYGIDSFMGSSSQGTWTVQVIDTYSGLDYGEIDSASIEFFGDTPTDDDVYHYTSDYAALVAQDNSRFTLTDTGGIDTVNFSTISEGIRVELYNDGTGGAYERFNGAPTTLIGAIASGTTIENAVMGDGNDIARGNEEDNILFGMRGNDRLVGFGGNDTLVVGQGDGLQFAIGGTGDDTYVISDDSYRVVIDTRNGGEDATGGTDTVVFEDLLQSDLTIRFSDYRFDLDFGYVLQINWNVNGESGIFFSGDAGRHLENFEFSDGSIVDWDTLLGDHHLIGTAAGETINGNSNNNLIEGGDGDDKLYGGDGRDLLDVGAGTGTTHQIMGGEDGNDLYIFNTADGIAAIDSRFEGAGQGTDRLYFEDLLFSDISASIINYTGTELATGSTLELSWNVNGTSGTFLIGESGQYIEFFEFADGQTYTLADFNL